MSEIDSYDSWYREVHSRGRVIEDWIGAEWSAAEVRKVCKDRVYKDAMRLGFKFPDARSVDKIQKISPGWVYRDTEYIAAYMEYAAVGCLGLRKLWENMKIGREFNKGKRLKKRPIRI